jgi:hypothetical protein
MGLDWNPASRARPGHETEFKKAKAKLDHQSDRMPWAIWLSDFIAQRFSIGRTSDQLQADFEAAAITPYETIGAPRVGIEEAATAWAKTQYDALDKKTISLDEYLRKLHGYWVLDLVPACDGFPIYSNAGLYHGAERFSFRGQFLRECATILGHRLLNEAWDPHDGAALVDYGNRLSEVARTHANKTGMTEWLLREEPPDETQGPAHETHLLVCAAKWCRFWGERGHGLDPYY